MPVWVFSCKLLVVSSEKKLYLLFNCAEADSCCTVVYQDYMWLFVFLALPLSNKPKLTETKDEVVLLMHKLDYK